MITDKIKKRSRLKDILLSLKKKDKKTVFTNGCFDLLHAGHVIYLEEAKRHGDILVVAINSDDSVKRLKGKGRPITNQMDRAKMLASLESVDFVTIFNEDDPSSIVKELNPDIIVKGSDYKEDKIIGAKYVRKRGGEAIRVPYRKGYSTSSLIKRIKRL